MGKLTGALLLVFAIEVALFLFSGTSYANSPVFNLIMNPQTLTSSAFYLIMLTLLAGAALAVVVPGAFYQVNQWALFAVAALLMVTYAVHITHFWAFIQGQLYWYMPEWSGIIASLIIGPFLIYYLMTIVEWTRGNQ